MMTTVAPALIRRRPQQRRTWSAVALGVAGLMLAASGCADRDVDDPAPSESPTQAGPHAQSALPSINEGHASETPATGPDGQRTEEAQATPTTTPDAEGMTPTPPVLPQAAIPDEEIRETYGGDSPEPAEEMMGTLCNLSRPHFELLSEPIVADGIVDDQMLRVAALSLSDDLGVWDGMAWEFPEVRAELDSAREIYGHWEYAVNLLDAGDPEAALSELGAASEMIAKLPDGDVIEAGC